MNPAPHRPAAPPADRRASWRQTASRWWRPATIVAVATAITLGVVHRRPVRERLPDFTAITDTSERKAAFFNYLAPLARQVNAEQTNTRKRLLAIDETLANRETPALPRRDFVRTTAARHGVGPADEIDRVLLARLLSRVDTVPPSLILAQAAIESGWGTSRFARQGNSLFGLRCYQPGCGIVPARRPPGARFEVAAYPDPTASVRAYVHNLNTHPRYRALRRVRAELRAGGQPVTGPALAGGLARYSELGSDYVGLVRTLIAENDLVRFDE
ncbi:MAG: glucosaminidase domain-containing protein [Verrucomicrobiota bacterium]